MSDRTGLGTLELAALSAVESLKGAADGRHRPTPRVLDELDRRGFGHRYAFLVLQDLAAAWRLHVPLLEGKGNWGTRYGDPAADARHTEIRLSPAGELALAAERGEVGPVPFGLIEGSLYRDGPVPPFSPDDVLSALRGDRKSIRPAMPTGGIVGGEVDALLDGRKARLTVSCTILPEPGRYAPEQRVITQVPLGVPVDMLVHQVRSRLQAGRRTDGRDGRSRPLPPLTDIVDESSDRTGLRVVLVSDSRTDPDEAEAWVRTIWPVTIEIDCRLPAPMRQRLREFSVGDGSGLDALAALLWPWRQPDAGDR